MKIGESNQQQLIKILGLERTSIHKPILPAKAGETTQNSIKEKVFGQERTNTNEYTSLPVN